MATKLQELLEELKGLKKYYIEVDSDCDFELVEQGRQDLIKTPELLIKDFELDTIIDKYTETTTTYKPGDEVLITKSCLKTLNGTKGYLIRLHSSKEKLWKIKHSLGICYFSEEEFEPIN